MKLGRLRPELSKLNYLHNYLTEVVDTPESIFYGRYLDYPMFLNDKLGDCTIAGYAHLAQTQYDEIGKTFITSDKEVKQTYFDITDGQDSGCVEYQVLELARSQGLLGDQISTYAPVRVDVDMLKQALFLGGGLYLGVNLPQSAEQEFADNKPWEVISNSPIIGGHCVIATGYNPVVCSIVTWGKVVSASWDWITHYTEEAWVILPDVWVSANKCPQLDLASLKTDFSKFY